MVEGYVDLKRSAAVYEVEASGEGRVEGKEFRRRVIRGPSVGIVVVEGVAWVILYRWMDSVLQYTVIGLGRMMGTPQSKAALLDGGSITAPLSDSI